MLKVTFITKAHYNCEVTEIHRCISDARLRAHALGWTIHDTEEV